MPVSLWAPAGPARLADYRLNGHVERQPGIGRVAAHQPGVAGVIRLGAFQINQE